MDDYLSKPVGAVELFAGPRTLLCRWGNRFHHRRFAEIVRGVDDNRFTGVDAGEHFALHAEVAPELHSAVVHPVLTVHDGQPRPLRSG